MSKAASSTRAATSADDGASVSRSIDRAESRGQAPPRDFLLLFFGTHAEAAKGTLSGNDGSAFHYDMSGDASILTHAD